LKSRYTPCILRRRLALTAAI